MLYRASTGIAWRDLPERFGAWKTIYNKFARWSHFGHWRRIFKALQLRVDEDGFTPATLTIPAGGIVELTNEGDEPHSLRGPRDIETGVLQPGDTVAIVLDDPGRFEYHDALAPEHEGVIVIEPAP